mmetsp:Transcript_34235/g.82859  ORF Transcript_34235/g.82859 Transcript_34235/m.82859 type:complete len:165 (+) Transcript_34235:444-938(+)
MASNASQAKLLPAPLPKRAVAKFVDLVAKRAMAISVGGIFSARGLILTTAYEVVLPVVWQGQTIGKRVMDIRFRRVDGKPIGIGTTLLRNIGDSLFYFLGFITAAVSKRSIADMMAGTEVIKVEAKEKETNSDKSKAGSIYSPPPKRPKKRRPFVISTKIRSSL